MDARADEDAHVHTDAPPEAPLAREHYNHALALVGEYRELMNKRDRTAADYDRMGELHTELIITQMCYNVSRWDDAHAEVPPEIQLPELPPPRVQPMEQRVARMQRIPSDDDLRVPRYRLFLENALPHRRLHITARSAASEPASYV